MHPLLFGHAQPAHHPAAHPHPHAHAHHQHQLQQFLAHHQPVLQAHANAAMAHPHHHHHASTSTTGQIDFLQNLAIQSPIDVYDIHETGWRRALLLAKRDRHEFLVRYIGWDSKWDEWIRASSGRLAPSNSKTASLAYTGFKGPKSADDIASMELGRDWNAARQEGVMCDVMFVLQPGRPRAGLRMNTSSPIRPTTTRNNSTRAHGGEEDGKASSLHASAPATPATSPMVRGLSGLGIISPRLGPMLGSSSPSINGLSPPIYFSAHSHIINMRCPDLLKHAVISLPPVTSFEEPATAPTTPFRRAMSGTAGAAAAAQGEEKKEEGRSLADQEMLAAPMPSAPASLSSILQYSLSESADVPASACSASPEVVSEEKAATSLDEDDTPMADLSRSASMGGQAGYAELHPKVDTYEVACVPNAAVMQNLLTYLYTGDLATHFLPTIRHVFELATVARLLQLDRLLDLCALALNRMLTQENFLMALKLGLHFQAKVLGNLDTICTSLQEAHAATTASLAAEMHAPVSSTSTAKLIHRQLSALVSVTLEYLILHWEACWAPYENLLAFQQLPPQIFQMVMRLLPMKHIAAAPFTPVYPTVHPQACNLTAHFKRLYEDRTEAGTDFRIIIGGETDDADDATGEDHVILCHKAVLACRSEYFRALFRCSFREGQENYVRLDSSQHHPASMEALVRYLYSADLKVDPNCGVYLSNCTDFFGLSSNALEHACQELVSQHHCLKVLKAAWKTANEGLFKRACKFIDWTTLATLMNGSGSSGAPALPATDGEEEEEDDPDEMEEMDLGEAVEATPAVGDAEEEIEPAAAEDVEAADEEQAAIAADAAPSASASPASSSQHTPNLGPRSRAHSSPSSPSVDASIVEMWKAIVQEKANPSAATPFGKATTAASKRSRST